MRVSTIRMCRTTALASLAIATLTYQPAANAEGDPARTAFGNTVSFGFASGSFTVSVPLAQVPVGKRYVIELVSLSCALPGGQYISSAVLHVGQRLPDGATSKQAFSISVVDQLAGNSDLAEKSHFVGTVAARMYADDIAGSPSDFTLSLTRTNTFGTSADCTVSFSGYLVSVHGEPND